MPFATGIVIWLVPAVVALGESSTAALELVRVTSMSPWFGAPSVKLVLSCSPLPTVSAPTEMVGWVAVIDRVAAAVAMKPGVLALTVVVPDRSAWNTMAPEAESVGVLLTASGIGAVCVVPAVVATFRSSPMPLEGVVKLTVSGARGEPARRFCSACSAPFPACGSPSRAYTTLEGDSVVVVARQPLQVDRPLHRRHGGGAVAEAGGAHRHGGQHRVGDPPLQPLHVEAHGLDPIRHRDRDLARSRRSSHWARAAPRDPNWSG